MDQIRELIYHLHYFKDFFNQQSEEVKRKINYVLYLVTHIDRIPESFLKQIEGQKGLYEIRVETGNNIFRIFCCFDKGKLVVLLNGYQKKSQKAPKEEINRAVKLMNDYFSDK